MDDRRNSGDDTASPKPYDRCIVVSPRHDFIRPWIRAYFSTGNTIPLVIIPGPEGDWRGDDLEYCRKAASVSGGIVFDCSAEWKNSKRLAERAAKGKIGWYTKKNLLLAVSSKLAPKSWAWIDDDAEITGNLDECFDYAEKAPGFICAQFYHPENYTPDSVDCRHPAKMYKWKLSGGEKLCWNSLVLFHGDANERLKDIDRDFPIEDDEIVFGHMYVNDPVWHEGFWDFSSRRWQANCKKLDQIPKPWSGKLLHYTSNKNGGEVKKYWAAKAEKLPKAPFEEPAQAPKTITDGPIDAVFVIGTGSKSNNDELRYALRNIDAHCPFIRNVYICGYCPSWVDRTKVRHLQWPDRFHHAKDANIVDKLRHACEAPDIAERVLFCSDDQFQTRKCTWDDFAPRYLRKYNPDDKWYEGRHRVWHTRLRATLERDRLRRESAGIGGDVYYYQPHMWMQIYRDKFLEYAKWCGYERRSDTIIASGYFNFINAGGRQDFDHVFLGSGEKEIPKATHVAYHDGSCAAALVLLKKMFPSRCRFELPAEGVSAARRSSSTLPTPPPPARREAPPALLDDLDPSPATPQELSSLLRVSAAVRENSVWHGMLGEISRAEEMRLFGAKGWRRVWRDIIGRWTRATSNGTSAVSVSEPRSDGAKAVAEAYASNPSSMRTTTFGPQPNPKSRYAPADDASRDRVRDKIRSALHLRGV